MQNGMRVVVLKTPCGPDWPGLSLRFTPRSAALAGETPRALTAANTGRAMRRDLEAAPSGHRPMFGPGTVKCDYHPDRDSLERMGSIYAVVAPPICCFC